MIEKSKKYILGCDVGNGYGYVSLLLDPVSDPLTLFPNNYGIADIGMPTTAYVVPPEGKNVEVFKNGRTAEVKYRSDPKHLVTAVKRRLVEQRIKFEDIETPVEVAHVYSAVVKDLLLLAEEELKNMGIEPVYDVVFTFPAEFADNVHLLEIMQQSIESIEINGKNIHVCGRLPEPAAVAIDYLHYMQYIAPENVRIKEDAFTVLIYDLGYGTFDTAVVTAQNDINSPYTLHSKDGLMEIGGKDFDQILYDEILLRLKREYGFIPQNEIQKEMIRQEAVRVKIDLSNSESSTAFIVNENNYLNIEISRKEFEELSHGLLSQTLELVQKVLDDAVSKGIKIDSIVLSGGASQMPMVRNTLRELMESKYPIVLHRPSAAVSFGAARFAYGIRKNFPVNTAIEQKTDCCYGIWLPSNKDRLEGEVRFLIPCGETRPATSKSVLVRCASSRLVVKLYRSRDNKNSEIASLEDCKSIMYIPFDVEPGTRYGISIAVLENYAVQVKLSSDNGEECIKTTSDEWITNNKNKMVEKK